MTPEVFLYEIIEPGLIVLDDLGGPPPTDDARRFLLAVALQESGAGLDARYQNSPSESPGPARGWWQFEQGGGVVGVLNHAISRDLAQALCAFYWVEPNAPATWRALEGHDLLAVGFARLLLLTDPYVIPIDEDPAWTCYAERLWRPGKPHRDKWTGNWATAATVIPGGIARA